jgi:predicted ATPase
MIRRVTLTNYGPFASAELELTPLTVVVGPNASGKSKLLELLHLLGSESRISSNFREFLARMKKRGSEKDPLLKVESSAGEETVCGSDSGESDSEEFFEIIADGVVFYDGRRRHKPQRGDLVGISDAAVRNTLIKSHKAKRVSSTFFLRLNPDSLRSPSHIDSEQPLIREDGYGLATNLAYLKLNDIDTFNRLLEQTRGIIPTFESLRFKQTRVPQGKSEDVYGYELIFDMKSAPDLNPDAVSDGTLLTLGLLTCTMEFTRRHKAESGYLLFLIDDVERGLHPRALAELVGQLRRITETTGAQILATSHSPYLLDAFRPEEVRLTGFLEDGSVTIRSLTDHPDFERWKDEMMPGEFWSMVGEDWIR